MKAVTELAGHPSCAACRGAMPDWRINQLFSYIEANLTEHVKVPQLCALVRMSPTHLSRTFKRHFGVGLRTYLMCRRVVMAQNLMLMTDCPLKEIAAECGLTDQSHLNRMFRALVGDTPASWREVMRAARDRDEVALPLDTTTLLLRHLDGPVSAINLRALQATLSNARELDLMRARGQSGAHRMHLVRRLSVDAEVAGRRDTNAGRLAQRLL